MLIVIWSMCWTVLSTQAISSYDLDNFDQKYEFHIFCLGDNIIKIKCTEIIEISTVKFIKNNRFLRGAIAKSAFLFAILKFATEIKVCHNNLVSGKRRKWATAPPWLSTSSASNSLRLGKLSSSKLDPYFNVLPLCLAQLWP